MVNGVRLALDVGSVRIGVAKCDAEGLLATPLVTITSGPDAVNEVYELVHEFEAKCVYVGKPISSRRAQPVASLSISKKASF